MEVVVAVGIVGILGYLVWDTRSSRKELSELFKLTLQFVDNINAKSADTLKTAFAPAVIVPPEQPPQPYDQDADDNRRYYPDHELDNFVPGSVDEIIGMGDGWLNPSSETTQQMKPPES